MNDKERILMSIVRRAYELSLIGRTSRPSREKHEHELSFDAENIKTGDLVMALTSQPDDFMVGYMHQKIGYSESVIREIGTGKLCNYKNEEFLAIRGLQESDYYDGPRREMYEKVLKVDYQIYDKHYRYLKEVKVTDDEVSFSVVVPATQKELFTCKFEYNSRTTIKSMVKRVLKGLRNEQQVPLPCKAS